MEFETNSYICRYCKGSFDHVENLQKHVEQIHTPRPTKDKFKFCPLCGLRCAKYETYRDHLKHIHRLSEEGKVFLLRCFNDFHVWKNELEKRMYCKYIQQGQPKVTQTSKDKIFVYRCDSSSSSTKEKKKSSWAAKDTCPSTISAIENVTNHTVRVEHWNTHVGHAIPIQGEELDAAIGSLQTTEIIIDEQSYQNSDHDSQSGLCFLTESGDGSNSESFVKETNKKHPPSLFKNNGNSSPSSMPRKFSFKKDPTKKSVSFSGSLASVACMKATVKKDSTTSSASDGKATTDAKSSSVKSSVAETSYSKFVSNAKDMKSSTPIKKTNSNNQKSGKGVAKQLAMSNLKHMVNDEKLNGQFLLLNSLQGPNGQQSLILCPVDGTLPSGVQPKNIDSKVTPCKKGQSPHSGQSSVSADKQTPASNDQGLKDTKPKKTYIFTKIASTEKSDNDVVKDAVTADISVEGNQGEEKLSKSEEESESPSVDAPSDSTKNISVPLVSILKTPNKSGSTDGQNVSLASTEKPKQAKKRAPRKQKLPVGDKLPPVTSSSTASPNKIGTILRNQLTGQQIMIPINVSSGLTNINSPMNKAGSIPMPVAGNVLSNSLTPGMSYIQINNTLIPINSPGGPNLNSNFIFTTPVSSSSNPLTSQPVLSFSALTQPATTKTLVVNTPKSSVSGSIPGNALNKAPNNNLSVFMVPQAGGKNTTSVPMIPISGVQTQNIGKPVTSGQMSKTTQIISNSPLQNSGNIRSPLIQTNAQFIPPRLLAVAQLCQRLNTPGSPGLTPIRGLSPVTPRAPNASQVKTVQLPLPVSTTSQLVIATSNSNTVNSVVANSGSISSTPAINIPSNPMPHPQKPGSFIFESSGDFFVLEPIEDSLKSVLPVKQSADLKSGAPKPRKVQRKVKPDAIACGTVNSPVKSSPKYSVPDSPKEDTKVELKLPKPRNYSRFYDGKKVSTLAQKRSFKEEDSDISQKVKYYNLEMKYLSSQAECKRLKLELAKSNMKKKESEHMTLNKDSKKENNVPDDTILEFSDHNPENDYLEGRDELIINQVTKNLLKKIEEDEANTKIRIETNEEPMDCEYEDINNKVQVDQPKEVTNTDVVEKDKIADSLDMKEDIHKNSEIEDMSIDKNESHNPSLDNDDILDQSSNSPQAENQSMLNEIPASPINCSGTLDDIAHNRELVNECLDSFENQPEVTSISESESCKTLIDQNLTLENKSGDLETIIKEQVVTGTNNIEDDQNAVKDVQYFDDEKSREELETDDSKCQKAEQTLKDLEIKYGEQDLDVYTMIRTSVLRSLYADMQDLCEENKKLFEELQSLKSNIETYEVIIQETPTEQL